jgi:LacI family transcriptional regulator
VWCELAPVALSAVEVRDQVLATQAMRLLRRLMGGGPAPKEPVMIPPVRITERQSTNVLAVDDPTVARALRYIWNHIELDLSVDDIAREVGVPRYRLERGFRRYLQRGVNAELRRRRLDEFRRLLRSSDAPIAELSARIGFRSLESMHRCFRNAYGTTPGRYRREHVWREGKE